MNRTMMKPLGITLLLVALILSTVSFALASPPHATYEVTITNLTDEGDSSYGQPLTPPLIATHQGAASFFQIGDAASEGIQQIAENGNLAPMLAVLETNKHVSHVKVALDEAGPPLVPGESITVNIDARPGANFLSFASMLICTNDGFTGVNRLKLPKKIGKTATAYTDGYDAGTEINTEDFADIVPPCQGLGGVSSDDPGTGMSNPELAENGVIMHHAGIAGGDDLLVDTHGWNDPVTKIEITRVN